MPNFQKNLFNIPILFNVDISEGILPYKPLYDKSNVTVRQVEIYGNKGKGNISNIYFSTLPNGNFKSLILQQENKILILTYLR